MEIKLAYGKTGLTFKLPEYMDACVLEPKFVKGLEDQAGAVRYALRHPINSKPLRSLITGSEKVGIAFSDLTRPTPNHILIPALCTELDIIPDEQILLFNSTGTHRSNTQDELGQMLGASIVDRYRIIQNNAQDRDSHIYVGTTKSGNEICLHKEFVECDVRIVTGFIEPHIFAGYSGGAKAIMPGLASLDSIIGNHSIANIDHKTAKWGITSGNPVWEEIYEVGMMLEPLFLVNVSLNKNSRITSVFAGDLTETHAEGCKFVREISMAPVSKPFDIVVGCNSGFPSDLNLYQSVKGMSAASQVVKKGGSIIIAAECQDGIPDNGNYGKLLKQAESPEQLLERIYAPGFQALDMWQAQLHAKICLEADVYMFSQALSAEQIRMAFLKPSYSIESTLRELIGSYGPKASVCVMPEGPHTIPYLA